MKKNPLSEVDIIEYLHRIMDSNFARFILKELSKPEKIQRALAIYAGVEKPHSIKERGYAKTVAVAIESAAKRFSIPSENIKEVLKDPYMRKGFSVIIRGIAEYGITRPQILSAPFLVVWNFTKQCNLKCRHCYADAGPHPAPDELNLQEKYEIVDQLHRAGVAAISFSGGEPLINRDFWPVVDYAARKGFYISVATNGTLITEEVAIRLRKIGVRYVEISIDGPDAEIHDGFRGVEGAFERSINGIKNSKKAGLEVGIATVVTHHNLDSIPEIVALARELHVDRLIVFNFIPTGRGKEMVDEDLSPEEREELMRYLYEEWEKGDLQIFSTSPAYARLSLTAVAEERGHKFSPGHFAEIELPEKFLGAEKILAEFLGGCGAGRIYCSIEHNGDIYPCVFLPIKAGNLIKDGFQNVWNNNEVLKKLRERDDDEYGCRSCGFRYVCGGCRARAYAYYGDIMAPDPGCIIMKDEWQRILERET